MGVLKHRPYRTGDPYARPRPHRCHLIYITTTKMLTAYLLIVFSSFKPCIYTCPWSWITLRSAAMTLTSVFYFVHAWCRVCSHCFSSHIQNNGQVCFLNLLQLPVHLSLSPYSTSSSYYISIPYSISSRHSTFKPSSILLHYQDLLVASQQSRWCTGLPFN